MSWIIRPTTAADVANSQGNFPKLLADHWRPVGNSRSFVAAKDDLVLGHCRAVDNTFHPQSRSFLLELANRETDTAIADALVSAQLETSNLPLHLKISASQVDEQKLAARHNGIVIQICPPWEYRINADMRRWATLHPSQAEPISENDLPDCLELWCQYYLKQHEKWTPAAELATLRTHFANDFVLAEGIDPRSVVLSRDGKIVAMAILWAADDEIAELSLVALPYESSTARDDMEQCLAAVINALPDDELLGIDSHLTEQLESAMLADLPGKAGGEWLAITAIPAPHGSVPRSFPSTNIPDNQMWLYPIIS